MALVAFVLNRTLLRDPGEFLRRCRRAAEEHGWDPWFAPTSDAENGLALTCRAVAAGASLVFAVGGDGTVRACAEALAGTVVPLAIVPLGTANLTARALGLPTQADRAVDVGFGGRDRRIDLCRLTRIDEAGIGGTGAGGTGAGETRAGGTGAGGMRPPGRPGVNSVSRPTDPTAITGTPVTFFVQPDRLSSGSASGKAAL